MKMKIYFGIQIAILILIASCTDNSTKPPDTQNLDTLSGTTWKWEKFKDEKGQLIHVADTNIFVFILCFENDTSAKGIAGCNSFGMNYKKKNDSIYFEPGWSTMVSCKFTDIYENSLFDTCQILSVNENELVLKTKNPSCNVMYFSRNVSNPTFHNNEIHDIDINNDSVVDFKFEYSDEIRNDTIARYTLNIVTMNDNMSTYAWGGCVEENQPIDDKTRFYSGKLEISSITKYYFGWYDYWLPPIDKLYLPIKLKLNDSYHYGWICISVSRINGNLKIHDFTYNKVPETMILAGKK